jgi:hypothetical protein
MMLAAVMLIIAAGLIVVAAYCLMRALRDAEQERLERSWRRVRDQGRP